MRPTNHPWPSATQRRVLGYLADDPDARVVGHYNWLGLVGTMTAPAGPEMQVTNFKILLAEGWIRPAGREYTGRKARLMDGHGGLGEYVEEYLEYHVITPAGRAALARPLPPPRSKF